MQLLRDRTGRKVDDLSLVLFESALAEIGANVLLHGRQRGRPAVEVEYDLKLEADTLTALFTDQGPPLHNRVTRPMPAATSEAGRGLAIARKVLDELEYQRDGEVNTWRLVKRL